MQIEFNIDIRFYLTEMIPEQLLCGYTHLSNVNFLGGTEAWFLCLAAVVVIAVVFL